MVSPGVAAPTPSLFSAAIRASRRPESAEPVLPVFGRHGGYRLVVRAARAEPLHRDMAHRYLVSAHLFSYPVGLPLLLLEKAEQVDLLVFGRCCPLCV